MWKTFKNKFIGDKHFYKSVLLIAVPIMIQNGISNFVNLLDNIMVGRLGTEQMSGVSIVNQLFFVYMLCMFGGLAGAGIFTAQYYGQKDDEGVRNTFRYKIWMALILTAIAVILFVTKGDSLIRMYLQGEGNVEATFMYAKQYLSILIFSLPGFMIVQTYASTLRECGQTMVPMKASVIAVCVNLVFNYLLIYGKLGLPALGVTGAAIATILARYVEVAIVVGWTHSHKKDNSYIIGLYRTLRVPLFLVKRIFIKGTPLLINECLWSAGTAMLLQCYSIRGLDVVAGMNISSTISNLFNVVFFALGDSVAIVVGQLLGAGKMKEAREKDTKLIAFSVMCCVGIAIVMLFVAPFFPQLYNTSAGSKELAKNLIYLTALFMPQAAFLHAAYFTLRSGGKTIITFFFDSVFMWVISVPVAFVLSRYTGMSVILIYAFVNIADWIKCIIGFILVKKGVWIQNIVD